MFDQTRARCCSQTTLRLWRFIMHKRAVNVSIHKRNDGDMIAREELPGSARWRLAIGRVLARYLSGDFAASIRASSRRESRAWSFVCLVLLCLGLFRSSLSEAKGRTRNRGTVQL